jgi:hypothetical protein
LEGVTIKFEYFIYRQESIDHSVLISGSRDEAIEFFNDLFMEIHYNNESDVVRIELREDNGDEMLSYDMHLEVVSNG